jgi:hypothetical protein
METLGVTSGIASSVPIADGSGLAKENLHVALLVGAAMCRPG